MNLNLIKKTHNIASLGKFSLVLNLFGTHPPFGTDLGPQDPGKKCVFFQVLDVFSKVVFVLL